MTATMEHISIPIFALLRYGTVIVRLKMESLSSICQHSVHPVKSLSRVVHRVARCEQCTRTRIVSQYSDCDSELMGTCRPYRTRKAKSRYVNVCAAVCLLLLVGGLTPQSSAAPHRTRKMDKRAADQEDDLWSNPCDLDTSHTDSPLEYNPGLAKRVAVLSKDTYSCMKEYQDDIAQLHIYNKFEVIYDMWKNMQWLRKHSWFTKEALPENKQLGEFLKEEELKELVEDREKIDNLLPVISKALKALGAGLRAVIGSIKWAPDSVLRNNLYKASNDVRHILCYCNEVLRARNLKVLPLYNEEIPKYTEQGEAIKDALLIYIDTINFLEYTEQLFTMMSKTNYEKN